jgi:DNA processing protein
MLKGRDVILFLAVKYQGDWNAIYAAIKNKELVDEHTVHETIDSIKTKTVAIIDQDYPEALKKIYKPPFVLFYNGELDVLQRRSNIGIFCENKPTQYTVDNLTEVIDEDRMTLLIHLESDMSKVFPHDRQYRSRVFFSSTGILPKSNDRNELYISEYPENSAASEEHINWTARLISGLSDVLLIPQAKSRGDKSLIAAGYTAYLNKPVAVIAQKSNDGTTKLLADGIATLVNSKQSLIRLIEDSNKVDNDTKKDESLLASNPVA